jgi:RHS repeat-associated protein
LWQEISLDRNEKMLEHIALDTNDLDGDSNTTEYRPYAVHEDFQNTAWGVSGADGDLAERYDYSDPYGVSETKDGGGSSLGAYASDVFNRKRLHGGFVEEVSGLYDFRNRWLNPETGSWLSRDPLGAVDSENLYASFLGRPNSMRDPNGLNARGWKNCYDCPCSATANNGAASLSAAIGSNAGSYPTQEMEDIFSQVKDWLDGGKVKFECSKNCDDDGRCADTSFEYTATDIFGILDGDITVTICMEEKWFEYHLPTHDWPLYKCRWRIRENKTCTGKGCGTLLSHEFGHILCMAAYQYPGVINREEYNNCNNHDTYGGLEGFTDCAKAVLECALNPASCGAMVSECPDV